MQWQLGEVVGERSSRRKAFFEQHPYCCFCGGGGALAVQEDHVPPRVMFEGRNWPTGYVFPACAPCNNGSTLQDRLFALVAGLPFKGPLSPVKRAEWRKITAAINKDHPGLVSSMLMSANEKRRELTRMEMRPDPGQAFGSVGLLRYSEEVASAVNVQLVKIAKAIHYLHTGLIVPTGAEITVFPFSNVELMRGLFPNSVLDDLPAVALTSRNGRSLVDQFVYRYGIAENKRHGLYVCAFGESLFAALFVDFVPMEEATFEDHGVEQLGHGAEKCQQSPGGINGGI